MVLPAVADVRIRPGCQASPGRLIGAITVLLFAATIGPPQNDIKRVVAYSTCSQLGYMFIAAGVGAYPAAMFHLFTHASFKALLFLGAGAVINAVHHEQDMRKMGGLYKYLPITYAIMLIGTISITRGSLSMARPGLLGFLFQGRHHRRRLRRRPRGRDLQLRLLRRPDRRRPDLVLLLAPDLHDLPRQAEVAGGRGAPWRRRPRQRRPWAWPR